MFLFKPSVHHRGFFMLPDFGGQRHTLYMTWNKQSVNKAIQCTHKFYNIVLHFVKIA